MPSHIQSVDTNIIIKNPISMGHIKHLKRTPFPINFSKCLKFSSAIKVTAPISPFSVNMEKYFQ